MRSKEQDERYDVIITGGGMGGLMCGALLSLKGYKTLLVDKHHQPGGNLQTFKRKGVLFNSAMHFVGSMEKGQILHQLFKYLGILEHTGLERLDAAEYEKLYVGDREYKYPSGLENHRSALLSYFPEEKQAISSYLDKIVEVWNSTRVLNLEDFRNHLDAETHFTQIDSFEYINSLTENPELRALWGMTGALHAGSPGKSPLLTHAIISYHYIQGAWKFSHGTHHLAKALANVISRNGGEVRIKSEVVGFINRGKEIGAIKLRDGSIIEGEQFISGLHPAQTIRLLNPAGLRKAWLSRIQALENTIGSFCVYIILKKKSFPYINSNINLARGKDSWNPDKYDSDLWPGACILYTTADKKNPGFAESLTISAFMKYDEVRQWENTGVGKRGKYYLNFKKNRAERLIDLVESRIKGLRTSIESYYTATPLTFRDYTGTPEGSIYGIKKDCNNPRESYISTRTRYPNLHLTGQSSGVGLHGVLGVSVSALFTCEAFLDIGTLLKKIRDV